MKRPSIWLVVAAMWLSAQAALAQTDTANGDDQLDRALASEARLASIERAALARHPALSAAGERIRAASERAQGADRLPDTEFKYEQWAVPLKRPYALNRADTLMFGLRQALPAPGTRDVRARTAEADSEVTREQRRALARDLLLRVRRAFFDYYAADRALRVHEEHMGLAEQMVGQVRSNYAAGQGNQQDVLKVLVELSRVHNDLTEIRQQRESARLLLNALMARAPAAPLGPPSELPSVPEHVDAKMLDAARTSDRPELRSARSSIKRSEAMLQGATYAARRPSFMVGADYWLMPTQDMPHAYGAMVTMSLPWFSRGHRADVREAEHLLAADRRMAEAVDSETAFELHDAIARLAAAQASLSVIERDLLAQAHRSLESAQASYATGQTDLLSVLDALRSYFQIRLEHSRARSRVMAQVADVEFASGAHLLGASRPETTR